MTKFSVILCAVFSTSSLNLLQVQVKVAVFSVKMEASRSSETSVLYSNTTPRYNPEDCA